MTEKTMYLIPDIFPLGYRTIVAPVVVALVTSTLKLSIFEFPVIKL